MKALRLSSQARSCSVTCVADIVPVLASRGAAFLAKAGVGLWQSFLVFPPQCVHAGVLTVRGKDGCLIGGAHRRLWPIRCYLQYTHSPRNPRSALRLRRLAESGGLAGVLFKTALLLWCRARFRTW